MINELVDGKYYSIVALDHYSSMNNEKACYINFIGKYDKSNSNDDYIALIHLIADIDNLNSAREYHFITINAIRHIYELYYIEKWEKKNEF